MSSVAEKSPDPNGIMVPDVHDQPLIRMSPLAEPERDPSDPSPSPKSSSSSSVESDNIPPDTKDQVVDEWVKACQNCKIVKPVVGYFERNGVSELCKVCEQTPSTCHTYAAHGLLPL